MTEEAPTGDPNTGTANFGPLIAITDVDGYVLDALWAWVPTYLKQLEIERELVVGSLARPKTRDIASALTDYEFEDHQMPAILATTAATVGEPHKHADGSWEAQFRVNISCIVRGQRPARARTLAAYYEGTIRRIIAQQAVPGASRIRWAGSQISPIPQLSTEGRYLVAGITMFTLTVDSAHLSGGNVGPTVPELDTYFPSAPADTVTTTVEALTDS
jgi:hypothetical protein